GRKNIGNNIRSGYMKDYDWFSTAEESEAVVLGSGLTKTEAENMKEEKSKALGVELDIKEEEGEYVVQYTPKEKDRGELSNFSKNKNYVKSIIGLDLTAKYYLKKDDKYKIAPMVGLNYDKFEFYALGGDQKNFIPGTDSYLLIPGDGNKGITYKQRFMTPYLGMYFDYTINSNWEVSLLLKGSAWGRARAKDRHLERGKMESFEKYKSIKYLSSNIAIKYHWNESLTLKY
ncbi:peptidase, partial [Fusobacterium necrophorum DAB]